MRRQRWGRTNNISPRWLACSVGDNKRGVRLGTVVHNPHAAGGGIGVCGTHFVRATMHRMVTRRCFHQRWVSGRPLSMPQERASLYLPLELVCEYKARSTK